MNTGKLRGCLASVVLAEHVAEEVHYPVTVAVFVVVPREGEMSFTKLSLRAMLALASKTDEWVLVRKSVETT